MHIDYSFHTVRDVAHSREREASSLWYSHRDRLLWFAVTATSATFIILSHDLRTFVSLIVKIAWLYMAAGARG